MLRTQMLNKLESAAVRGRMPCRPCCVAAATLVKRVSWRHVSPLIISSTLQLKLQIGIPTTTLALEVNRKLSFGRLVERPAATPNSTAIPESLSNDSAHQLPGPEPSRDLNTRATASLKSSPVSDDKARRRDSGTSSKRGTAGTQRARGSTPAAASLAAQTAADALFIDPGQGTVQATCIGPVRVASLGGGRGRGLVTTRTVQPGELLLAVQALALAWDEQNNEGEVASNKSGSGSTMADMDSADAKFLELQRQLLGRRYTPREAAWLSSLAGLGPSEDEEEGEEGERNAAAAVTSAGGKCSLPPPPELESSLSREGVEETRQELLPLPTRLRNPDALADVVQANSLEPDGGAEDEYAFWARHDAAAATAAVGNQDGEAVATTVAATSSSSSSSSSPSLSSSFGSSSPLTGLTERPRRRRGPMGLWPEAAMLNHSCLPNTVAYIVGDRLFVRAARKVGGGSELTVSYLPVGGGYEAAAGDESEDVGDDTDDTAAAATLLSPLAERRNALEELRGFICRCNRCTAEESLDPKLRALMADISEGVAALQGDLQTALALADLEEGG
ncbi:hypothetical protein VaNZ11_002318, partial [Volvox africanus]